jgi:hypothetical protein
MNSVHYRKSTLRHVSLMGTFALGAFLVLSLFVIQAANAQIQEETFDIRLTGNIPKSGLLVSFTVNGDPPEEPDPVFQVFKNSPPISITANVPENAPVTICVIEVTNGNEPLGCRTVNDAHQSNEQTITIPVNSNKPT